MTPSEDDEEPFAGSHAPPIWVEVSRLREQAARLAAAQAEQLRLVAALVRRTESEARQALAAFPRMTGQPLDEAVLASEVTVEVQAALGTAAHDADALAGLAVRLTLVLPSTLAALRAGRIDVPRARALADLTRGMSDGDARRVEREVLATAGDAPWAGPSPRAFRTRVSRVVDRVDADAAYRRRAAAMAERAVRVWPNGDGTSQLMARGSDEDVLLADQVLSDLALGRLQGSRPTGEPPGRGLDQARSDALFDLLRRVHDGAPLPAAVVRRERELGLVLHTDTLFADGAAADDPGQRRGLGLPVPVDGPSAREEARQLLARGRAARVLLVGADGGLTGTVRLPAAPSGGWTRTALLATVRDHYRGLEQVRTERYSPTTSIVTQVRVRNPTCTAYDCPRPASRCDLDHDAPWPRGPTSAANLAPRCRRHHQLKTRGLLATRLAADGAVTSTTLGGSVHTTRPEPLPGFGVGEAYAPVESGGGAVDVA